MDMAHAMYIDAQKYDTIEERTAKLHEKYEEIFHHAPGLYLAARDLTLYEGQMGAIVKAFQAGKGDPTLIQQNLQNIARNDQIKAEANYQKYFVG